MGRVACDRSIGIVVAPLSNQGDVALDIDRLKKRVCKEVDKAQCADEIFAVVRKYSHILEDDQILKLFKSMHGMSSANDLFCMGAAARYLAPYIKDEWLQYIPEPVISHCSAMKIRLLTCERSLWNIVNDIINANVSPAYAYEAYRDLWRRANYISYDDAKNKYTTIMKYPYDSSRVGLLPSAAYNGYFSGLPLDMAAEMLELVRSRVCFHSAKYPRVLEVNVIRGKELIYLRYLHYKLAAILLAELEQFCRDLADDLELDILRHRVFTKTLARAIRTALYRGMLAARIPSSIKIGLATLFPDVLSTRIFTKEEYDAAERVIVANKIRDFDRS